MVSLPYAGMKSPGVFLEERVPASQPELMVGVPVFVGFVPASTSIAAEFLQPQKFALWPQFLEFHQKLQQMLPQPAPQPPSRPCRFLADAVRGFFENGGRLCYVYLIEDPNPVTVEGLAAALESLEVLDMVDLVCVPDLMGLSDGLTSPLDQVTIQQLQTVILAHCAKMGDRFAILDGHDTTSSSQQQDYLASIQAQKESLSQEYGDWEPGSFGALYFPWLQVESTDKKPRWVPPCGHIAGTYARCDRTFGVHHAPANTPLDGILNIALNLSDGEQAALNAEHQVGVNCIRAFRGRGIRAWGSRTLSQKLQWQHVNVRRLFLTVGRWVNFHLAEAVFEPNDASLWLRLEREVSVYCESLWRQGALQGATAKDAFYVRCNAATNPPALCEVGQVCVELGLAPTIPGEFIRVSLIHGDNGVTLNPA